MQQYDNNRNQQERIEGAIPEGEWAGFFQHIAAFLLLFNLNRSRS